MRQEKEKRKGNYNVQNERVRLIEKKKRHWKILKVHSYWFPFLLIYFFQFSLYFC